MKKLVIAAFAAAALVGMGCNDRTTAADTRDNDTTLGTGGSGYENDYEHNNPGDDSKRLGDGKIGDNNGVIDDGEGPLEGNSGKADDKIGDQPGVWNDGEGPVESTPLNRESDTGRSFDNDQNQDNDLNQ